MQDPGRACDLLTGPHDPYEGKVEFKLKIQK